MIAYSPHHDPWKTYSIQKNPKHSTSLTYNSNYVPISSNKPKKNSINNKHKSSPSQKISSTIFNKKYPSLTSTPKIPLHAKTLPCFHLRSHNNKMFLVKIVKACWFCVKVGQQIVWEEVKMIIHWLCVKSKTNVQVVQVKQ